MDPVLYFNRYTQQVETETIYGEEFLRWVYEHPFGRFSTEVLVKREVFSAFYGWRMNQSVSREKIEPFIEKYQISVAEMKRSPKDFENFNAFFARELKPEARPIHGGAEDLVFPADGRHFVIPHLDRDSSVFVKGFDFDVVELLNDLDLAEKYKGGSLVISRLCPVDYHRFHVPCAGKLGEPRLINGPLYSVNPIALRSRPSIFWENKRYVTPLKSDNFGEIQYLEVGATCVGTVVHTVKGKKQVKKGEEKGYFLFGGSTVITVFEPNKVQFAQDLLDQSKAGFELYAKMGDLMGRSMI